MKAEELTDSKEKFDDPPAENLHGLLSDLKPLIVSLKNAIKTCLILNQKKLHGKLHKKQT